MTVIRIEITATRGSTPRDAGTVMAVSADAIEGTIGGGALEHRAIATAREMLRDGTDTVTLKMPLGPALGQCCGGAVTLRFDRQSRVVQVPAAVPIHPASTAPPLPLWLWGAGHVGRAIVAQAVPTGAFDITWIDDDAARFPAEVPQTVTLLPAADMPRVVTHAPRDAHHLIMTYSHDIDLALCAATLRHGFASCGLIGSDTKRARFARRLQAAGLDMGAITCPIGDKAMGKHPQMIAAGTIQALRALHRHKETV